MASSLVFSTAFTFKDVEDGQAAAVSALQERGVVSGIDSEHFAPKEKISYAQSVQMIVKGLDFNLDAMRFIRQPVASELYTNVHNDDWYADAFIIAHYNGLEIPKDVNPHAAITREQFADLLVRALEKKATLPMIKMYINIQDGDQINPEYQGRVQRLLLYRIAELGKDGKWNPKDELTRGEAATWVYNAIRLIADHTQKPAATEEVSVSAEKVNDDIQKVTLSRGVKPNAGYSIEINSIQFEQDGRAIIRYTLHDPQPDRMYAEVKTEAKAATYISSQYKAVAEPSDLTE